MRVVKNEKLIHGRGRISRWFMPLGLVALVAGFIFSLNVGNITYQAAAWGCLVTGIIFSSIGVNLADKWLSLPQRPRADEILENALHTLDIRHKLYSWTLPATEQVLLSPAGLTVFLVKRQEGTITCQDGKWKHRLPLRLLFASLSRERFGNPTKDLQTEIDKVKTLAKTVVPDADIPVDGLIVLGNPTATIKLDGCDERATVPADLREKFRLVGGGQRRLTDSALKRLEEALDAVALPNAEPVPVKAPKKTVTTSATSSGVRRAKRGSRRFRKPQQ